MARGLIALSSLLLCLSLVGAVPKQEIYGAINRISNEIRSSENLALHNAITEASGGAVSPLQRSCVHRQSALARRELNAALGRAEDLLRKEYGVLGPVEVDQLSPEEVERDVRSRLTAAVAPAAGSYDRIRACL